MAISHITDGGDRAEMPSFRTLVRRSWWLIAPIAILGLVGGAAFASIGGKSLESTVQVQVIPTVDNRLAPVRSGQLVNLDTESVELRSDALLAEFAKAIGSTQSTDALRTRVTVTAVSGSLVLKVTYEAPTGTQATQGAVELVNLYLAQRRDAAAAEVNGELAALAPQIAKAQSTVQSLVTQVAPLKPNGQGPNSGTAADVKRQQLNAQLNAATAQVEQLQSRENQLKRVVVTPGNAETGPSSPVSTKPPRTLTAVAGGLAGLFLGFAVAATRERLADSGPTPRLARRARAAAIVTFSGPNEAAADLQSVLVGVDPKLGSLVATTAIGRATSSKLASDLAELSAKAGNETVIVFAASIPDGQIAGPVVTAPLTGEEALEAAAPVGGIDRLSAFVVQQDDPALFGDAFTAALSALARSKECVVILDAPPLKASSPGQVILRHADSSVIVTDRRLSRRAVRDAALLEGLRARVVVVGA